MMRSSFSSTLVACLVLALPAAAVHIEHSVYNLSERRIHAGAVAWGTDAIAVAGGKTAVGWSSAIDVLNLKTKAWTKLKLPQQRADQGGPAEGALPNGLAFFGGQIATGSDGSVAILDSSSSGKQVATAKLKVPRSILSCASSVAQPVIVCAGGQDKQNEQASLFATDVFNLKADGSLESVQSGANLRVGRKKLSGAAAGELMAFGMGYSDVNKTKGYCDAVDIYNVTSRSWTHTELPSGNTRKDGKRMYGTAVGCGGFIIFAGGQIGGGRSAAVDVLDSRTASWIPSVGNLSVARSAVSSACASDRFALFGGGQIPLRDEVDVLDTASMQWLPTLKLNTPRSALAAAGNGDCAMFAGGLKQPNGTSDTDVFCFSQ